MSKVCSNGLRLASAGAMVWLAGCAIAQPVEPSAAAVSGSVVNATLNIGGTDYNVDWFLPDTPAVALVTVQHGFTRHCDNIRGTASRLMEHGLMGLCVNASMSGGNPALAEALAATLLSGISAPGGIGLPQKIIAGGHSAGGHFASRLGWALAATAPQRLAGALLFDPVAADASFTTNLMTISATGARPVLAVSANASGCNANNNAYAALRQVQRDAIGAGRDGFVGLQLTDHSTHIDVEGRDTDVLGIVACGQGRPRVNNVNALRTLAAQWALDEASGVRDASFYPGGRYVDRLIDASEARVIE